MLRAIGQQLAEQIGNAFLALGRLHFGPVADMAEDADRIAHILGLHDQRQAIGQVADHRVRGHRRHRQAVHGRLRPVRQRSGLGFPSEMFSWPPKPPPPPFTGLPEPLGSITAVTAWSRFRYCRAPRD